MIRRWIAAFLAVVLIGMYLTPVPSPKWERGEVSPLPTIWPTPWERTPPPRPTPTGWLHGTPPVMKQKERIVRYALPVFWIDR